ncbi:MAG: aminopeptidase P family protein [Acidimicrobiaceae bacterium]|nr:aminopeptidase P family protein [Acidimicrobiaceae bacterium]
MDSIPSEPDLDRMRRDRHQRLQQQLSASGLDGLLLLGPSAVAYATGADVAAADSSHTLLQRAVAVVAAGAAEPQVFTAMPEVDDGARQLASQLAEVLPPGALVAADDVPHPLRRQLSGYDLSPADSVLGAAKICKTPDELACIRGAQRINELAMWDALAALRPGVRQTDLSAVLLQRVFELGATSNAIDPIWQVMTDTLAAGPWTTHGGIAFPTSTTDRILRDGEVIWVDSGISWHGYASDFGRTWIVGLEPRPDSRQREQFSRWQAVIAAVLDRVKPGATALELCEAAKAANDGVKPWIDHFYLAHGVGTDSAEMPLIGTDLGEEFDAGLVLQPGMVLVLEPVIWDEGAAGYRSEDIVAVTDEAWVALSDFPYEPFS